LCKDELAKMGQGRFFILFYLIIRYPTPKRRNEPQPVSHPSQLEPAGEHPCEWAWKQATSESLKDISALLPGLPQCIVRVDII
jgi:hypothetical protein